MENDTFKNLYNSFLDDIEKGIQLNSKVLDPVCLYEPFNYQMSGGGKRLRPLITMLSAGAVGADPAEALNSGIAIEILHNFTLVHDDIMDKSPMRRNRPTVHTKWDEPTGILVGDVMVGIAYNLLPTPAENKNSGLIYRAFNKGLIEVCEGQAYDMEFNSRTDVSYPEYIQMISKKTARLLETCSVIGALIGNAFEEQIDALQTYANSLGLAFQIQDDMLDLIADQKLLGKTLGLDIVEGKKTYFIIKALELAVEKDDRDLLNSFMTGNGLPADKVSQMRNMFERLDLYSMAQTEIDNYFNIAADSLLKLEQNQYTKMLDWLIKKLNKRNF